MSAWLAYTESERLRRTNHTWEHRNVTAALERNRQENWKHKVMVSYAMSLRLICDTQYPISKQKKMRTIVCLFKTRSDYVAQVSLQFIILPLPPKW